MEFFQRAQSEYEVGFIKKKDLMFRKPMKTIRSISPYELIDTVNPFYYLNVSCVLVLELIIESMKQLLSSSDNAKSMQELKVSSYLFFIAFNFSLSLLNDALIATPFLLTFILMPSLFSPLVASYFLVQQLFLLKLAIDAFSENKQERKNGMSKKKQDALFSELAKEVNEQTTLQLEEIKQLKEALYKLKEDESAYIEVAKIQHPELWALAESTTAPPADVSARAVDRKDKEMMLTQLLNTYPDLPPKGQRSYDEVKQYYEESSVHHSQVLELANIVLFEGYQGIQYSEQREYNPELKNLLNI